MLKPGANKQVAFISWAPFCSRSDSIVRHLDGKSYMVYSAFWGSNYFTVIFKYLVQSLRTLWILVRERPHIVFVMTPPVVACLPVWLYAVFTRSSYIIDAHSGAFLDPRWQSTLFLHRFFSRRARTTLVTNSHLRDIVRGWNANAMIVSDVPVCFAEPRQVTLPDAFNVTLINTFTRDEPLELFLQAAHRLPEIQFHVTGPLAHADQHLVRGASKNVRFTGFLPDSEYVGLLLASDAIMCLTTLEHTMQRGAYEAVYLGKPILVSSTQFLREAFYRGAVHVDNTVAGIVDAVLQMKTHLSDRQVEVQQLRLEKLEQWSRVEAQLIPLLHRSKTAHS